MSYMIEFTKARNVKPVLGILEQQDIKWASGDRATTFVYYFFDSPTTLMRNCYLVVCDTIFGKQYLRVGHAPDDLQRYTLKKDTEFLKESKFHNLIIINQE